MLTQGCDDTLSGEFNENQPPRTFLTVEDINLEGDNRLASRVEVEWWGDDPDGYVVAYEICIGDEGCDPAEEDTGNWERTESTDTTLVLPIPAGDDVADVLFSVRAIDNEGLRDPEGASVRFPIENSPPQINFDPTVTPPDTTYSFFSFGFIADDPDGEEDLNFYEVAVNDTSEGNWVEIDRDIDFFTLDVNQQDVNANGSVSADLLTGRALNDTGELLEGIELNEENTIYLRAYDQSLAQSELAEFEWYIKEQQSNILFINDDAGVSSSNDHLDMMQDLGLDQVDYWDISEAPIPSGEVMPVPIDPTLRLALSQWDHIYWVSNNLENNFLFASEATVDFRNEGGTMFVNIPSLPVSSQNEEPVFNLLPFSGFEETPPGQSRFVLSFGAELFPLQSPLSALELGTGFVNINPMTPEGGATSLYEGDFNDPDDHGFSKLLSAVSDDQNVLYFGISLLDFTDESPVDETLEYFLIDQLQFEN